MELIRHYIEGSLPLAWIALVAAFVVLAKCADLFVDSSVKFADKLGIPKLVVGIVLVAFATTAPELSVSLMAALRGMPEMALGNAVGSVICDDGIALALAGILASGPIIVQPKVLKTAGLFLIGIDIVALAFLLPDCTLSRVEGAILVLLFFGYMALLFVQSKRGDLADPGEAQDDAAAKDVRLVGVVAVFAVSLAGILVASEFIVTSATVIARSFDIPEAVIAMTLVAFGTSVPEIATCVSAARKGEGAIAVGNILGADIMNICWIAGASAIANDLVIGKKELLFMFPAMLIIVLVMLGMLRYRYTLTRRKGIVLLVLYIIYLGSFFVVFPPVSGG